MRLLLPCMICCVAVAMWTTADRGDEGKDRSTSRDSLEYISLSNFSTLSIRTSLLSSPELRQTVEVYGFLDPKGKTFYKGAAIWKVPLTTVDYSPETRYYALVKIINDQILIFTLWNGQYNIIDKNSGQVVKKGKGDDLLKEYSELAPLKLAIIFPSTGRTMTDQEADKLEKWEADPERVRQKER
jgi:hypothetical protein